MDEKTKVAIDELAFSKTNMKFYGFALVFLVVGIIICVVAAALNLPDVYTLTGIALGCVSIFLLALNKYYSSYKTVEYVADATSTMNSKQKLQNYIAWAGLIIVWVTIMIIYK